MEVERQPNQPFFSPSNPPMSQGFYAFSDGFERPAGDHVATSRRETAPLVPMPNDYYDVSTAHGGPSGGMLSEMFGFSNPSVDVLQLPNTNLLGVNPDTAAVAMQLFLMNPNQQERGSSSSPQQRQGQEQEQGASHLMLHSSQPAYYTGAGGGLSLSLNSNLQQRIEMAKVEEGDRLMGVRDGMAYYNSQEQMGQQVNVGLSGPMAMGHVLRQSKYTKPAQELLREFCSVGRGQVVKGGGKRQKGGSSSSNPNPNSGGGGGVNGGASSSNSKEIQHVVLSPSDRFEYQRRKAKLMAMLDEVDRRYGYYCEQMQAVVNSFDSVMGFGAAAPYTALAQKAMSRHFRCLKDAVTAQLRNTCEILGEKDCSLSSGITKAETPRLRLLDQSLRQQRAFHQMGMMDTEAWRPQRGLPDRSVTILRAWLFEHFLHPYPSDADKHLLSRQTGLSRSQVSNWFINARVRLWKPMIEEMYQQEAKEAEENEEEDEKKRTSSAPLNERPRSPTNQQHTIDPRSSQNASSSYAPSLFINKQQFQHNPFSSSSSSIDNSHMVTYQLSGNAGANDATLVGLHLPGAAELCAFDLSIPDYGVNMVDPDANRIRFGSTGDVSLTLGLQHASNVSEGGRFSIRDFGNL